MAENTEAVDLTVAIVVLDNDKAFMYDTLRVRSVVSSGFLSESEQAPAALATLLAEGICNAISDRQPKFLQGIQDYLASRGR